MNSKDIQRFWLRLQHLLPPRYIAQVVERGVRPRLCVEVYSVENLKVTGALFRVKFDPIKVLVRIDRRWTEAPASMTGPWAQHRVRDFIAEHLLRLDNPAISKGRPRS